MAEPPLVPLDPPTKTMATPCNSDDASFPIASLAEVPSSAVQKDALCSTKSSFTLAINTPPLKPGVNCPPTPPPESETPPPPQVATTPSLPEALVCRLCARTYKSSKILGSHIRARIHQDAVVEAWNNLSKLHKGDLLELFTCLLCDYPLGAEAPVLDGQSLKAHVKDSHPAVWERSSASPHGIALLVKGMRILHHSDKKQKKGRRKRQDTSLLAWECQLCRSVKYRAPTEDMLNHLSSSHGLSYGSHHIAEKDSAMVLVDWVEPGNSGSEGSTGLPSPVVRNVVVDAQKVGGTPTKQASSPLHNRPQENVPITYQEISVISHTPSPIKPSVFVNNGRMPSNLYQPMGEFNSMHALATPPPDRHSLDIVDPDTGEVKVFGPIKNTPSPPTKKLGIKITDPTTGREKVFVRPGKTPPNQTLTNDYGHFSYPGTNALIYSIMLSKGFVQNQQPGFGPCPKCRVHLDYRQLFTHYQVHHPKDPALQEANNHFAVQQFQNYLQNYPQAYSGRVNAYDYVQQQYQYLQNGVSLNEGTFIYGGNQFARVDERFAPDLLHNLKSFIHPEQALVSVGYRLTNGTSADDESYMKCTACHRRRLKLYGEEIDTCMHHPGKITLNEVGEQSFECCGHALHLKPEGCTAGAHRFQLPHSFIPRIEFSTAPPNPNALTAVSIDCEMAATKSHLHEVIQICVVDILTGDTIINTLVKPDSPITDYRTKWSGVTRNKMNQAIARGDVVHGWRAARDLLFRYIGPETIISGHALHNDLQVLRVAHRNIVDTQMVIADATGAGAWSLKDATFYATGKMVQTAGNRVNGREQHDCLEDTLAARDLVIFFCGKDMAQLKEWGENAVALKKSHYLAGLEKPKGGQLSYTGDS